MKSYHKDKGWLLACVGHPTGKDFLVRFPFQPHDGPADALEMLPPAFYLCGSRERFVLRPKLKKDGTRAVTKLKGASFDASEYAYEEVM